MPSTQTPPAHIANVGIVFSGGPAPAANAVIAAAGSAFKRVGSELYGLLQGYAGVMDAARGGGPLVADLHYCKIQNRDLRGLRNERGVLLGTARVNPGKEVKCASDLDDPQKTQGLCTLYDGLRSLKLDALVSIGGDGTLRTANLLYEYQKRLPKELPRVRVVHVPKTIDNDYDGIDFTFGFFTAVEVMSKELLNLRADAIATQAYYIVSTMGRRAGWLAYGVAIAGEAHLVIGVEDVQGALRKPNGKLDLMGLVDRIVDLIATRRGRDKRYGVVVLAEGLTEELDDTELGNVPRDEFGHISFAKLDLGKMVAERVRERCTTRIGSPIKVTGVQLGYESRCAAPHAFDVLLGAQLGFGAYRALAEEHLDGHMISASGQLEVRYVPFAKLVDPNDYSVATRLIKPGSDFHRLAQQLGTRIKVGG